MDNETRIRLLVKRISQVNCTEFWWGSQLLENCAREKDPRITHALLFRHHCLLNKDADSAHMIRQTIKKIDEPDLKTLWDIIDNIDPSEDLTQSIADPYSMTWAACYVLGEVGGIKALHGLSLRLTADYSHLYYLTVRMLSQLLIRYLKSIDPEEPMMNQLDFDTNRVTQIPVRKFPEEYDRIMLRRREENEYFKPLNRDLQKLLIMKVSLIPDKYFNIEKKKMLLLLDKLPMQN